MQSRSCPPTRRAGPAGKFGVFLLLVVVAPAAAIQEPPPLTLRDLYRAVDSASPVVRMATAASLAAGARVPGASRLPDPRVELQLMNRNLPGLGLSDPLGMNQIQLSQMFPVAGQLGLSGQAARAAADAVRARRGETIWEQRAQVAMAFYDLYQAEERLEVGRETLGLLEDLAASLLPMYAVGEARQADVLRAQLEIGRMTAELEEMASMRRAMAARLNALLDRPAVAPLGRPALAAFPETLPGLDSLVQLAEAGRPMIQAGRFSVTEAELLARRARREIWPDFEIAVAYGQRPMPEGGTDRMVSLMVGASVPIWAGSRQLRMRDEAGAMRQMAEADLATMKAVTRGRIAERLSDLERSRTLTRLYRDAVLPQAGATVASARSAYQVGEVDLMTFLDAIMTVNAYREELLRLAAVEGQALADLEMLIGRPLVAGIPVAPDTPSGGTP